MSIGYNKSKFELGQRVSRVASALGRGFHDRFALCPLTHGGSWSQVIDALAAGKVPVVIADAWELPLADEIDYSSILFRIGTCPSELELLRSVEQVPDDVHVEMCRCGRMVYEQYFRDADRGMPAELHDVDFPARLPDGRIVRESEWMRLFWRSMTGRILIFGAGKYFHRLMEATAGEKNGPHVVGVLDDSIKAPTQINGYPLGPGDLFERSDFDAVFLATDSLEEHFASRVHEMYGPEVPLCKPSQLMKNLDGVGDDLESCAVPSPLSFARHPLKLEGILVCAGYSDFLSWSLPRNVEHFDRLVVVTSPEDTLTQALAEKCGAEVVISDRFRENGAVFNKGKMLNDGFARLDMDGWVLVTDADVIFRSGMRRRLFSRLLNENTLYYATRFNTPEEERESWLSRWFEEPELFSELSFSDLTSNQMPWGYFQLFHGNKQSRYSEAFDTAGEVDYEFQARWPVSHRVLLPEGVVHIAHGETGKNWNGRVSEPLCPKDLFLRKILSPA